MYAVYAIKSKSKNYIYIGQTSNLDKRIKQHNSGREKTTKAYRPFILIHVEFVNTRLDARKLEKYLKSGYGKEIVKDICNEIVGVVELVDTQS